MQQSEVVSILTRKFGEDWAIDNPERQIRLAIGLDPNPYHEARGQIEKKLAEAETLDDLIGVYTESAFIKDFRSASKFTDLAASAMERILKLVTTLEEVWLVHANIRKDSCFLYPLLDKGLNFCITVEECLEINSQCSDYGFNVKVLEKALILSNTIDDCMKIYEESKGPSLEDWTISQRAVEKALGLAARMEDAENLLTDLLFDQESPLFLLGIKKMAEILANDKSVGEVVCQS